MLGILCGIEREARIARQKAADAGLQAIVVCSGARPENAASQAEALVAGGATRLLSFGVAGGLSPSAAQGGLCIPVRVTDSAGIHWNADKAWFERMTALNAQSLSATIFGSDTAITTPDQKQRLHKSMSAALVDMESHHLARVAARAGLPFLAMRAVADTTSMRLPQAAMSAIDLDGRERPFRAALALARRPWEISELVSLARASNSAFATLGRVRLV